MSREVVETIHYYYAQNSKKFKAYDIIDNGKAINVLEGDKKGLKTWAVFDKKSKEKIRGLLKELEELKVV